MDTANFGPAYDQKLDEPRLTDQRRTICNWMLNRGWRTLYEIAAALGFPESSVSAQLRHLRKPQYGGFRVEKRRYADDVKWQTGTWQYRVLSPIPPGQMELL